MTDRLTQILTTRMIPQLIDMWEEARSIEGHDSRTVRLWISDELMNRDEAAFIKWANSSGYQSPRAFFGGNA